MQTIGISTLQDIRKFKGFENAVIAGGFVRDSILGGEPTDIDIFVPVRDTTEFIRILDEALGIEPKTNIEKKKTESKKNHSELQGQIQNSYPEELQKKFGGALLPLDTIENNGKISVIINNVLLPAIHWPYQLIKIEGRYYSIVEDTLYVQLLDEKQKRKQNNNNGLDPNSKYMVSNNSSAIGKDTHIKGGDYQQPTIPSFSAASP